MKIKGNTVSTTMPRSNYNQTDPKKADYIIGRENILSKSDLDAAAGLGTVPLATSDSVGGIKADAAYTGSTYADDSHGDAFNIGINSEGKLTQKHKQIAFRIPLSDNVEFDFPIQDIMELILNINNGMNLSDSFVDVVVQRSYFVYHLCGYGTTSSLLFQRFDVNGKLHLIEIKHATETTATAVETTVELGTSDDHINELIDAYIEESLGGEF